MHDTAAPERPPRLAVMAYNDVRFDSGAWRVARSASRAGWDVVIYARWRPGLPRDTVEDGVRVVRVAERSGTFVLSTRGSVVIDLSRLSRLVRRVRGKGRRAPPRSDGGTSADAGTAAEAVTAGETDAGLETEAGGRGGWIGRRRRVARRWLRFPHQVLPWAVALDAVVGPADVWHARLIGGLPAAVHQARRLGGAVVYDSADVYVQSHELAAGGLYARAVAHAERAWVRRCAAVITVSDLYAALLERQLRLRRRPLIVNTNVPETWTPPPDAPDLIRAALDLPATMRIALYHGALLTGRGIEQAAEAVAGLPDTVLVLLGYGRDRPRYEALAREPRFDGRIRLLPPVPPDELIGWVASADVAVMTIQDTTPNHRNSTPNKLFEAIAAGVPVVASDLPGLASVVTPLDCGLLVDPSDPSAIAAAIRELLDEPAEKRAARRDRMLRAARETYDWEQQATRLLGIYDRLLNRR